MIDVARPPSARGVGWRAPTSWTIIGVGALVALVALLARDSLVASAIQAGWAVAPAAAAWRWLPSSSRRKERWLVAIGFTLVSASEILRFFIVNLPGKALDYSFADGLMVLAFGVLLLGLSIIARECVPSVGRAGWIDGAILGSAVLFIVWFPIIEPAFRSQSAALIDTLLQIGYPVLGAVLLGVSCRLALSAHRDRFPYVLLAGGFGVQILTEVIGASDAAGRATVKWGLDSMVLFSYSLFAAAILGPGFGARQADRSENLCLAQARRVMAIEFLTGTVPVLAIAWQVRDRFAAWTLVLCASAAAAAAALTRVRSWGMMRDAFAQAGVMSERRIAALVDNATDVLGLLDGDGNVRFVSPGITRITGLGPSQVTGKPLVGLLTSGQELIGAAMHEIRSTEPHRRLEAVVRHADGSERIVDITLVNRLDDPAVEGIVLTMHDVTEDAELREQLRHASLHDALTGLPNRALFADRVEHALSVARKQGDVAVGLLVIDLDHFKAVNDSLGHVAGDTLLRHTAASLQQYVGEGNTVARLGGDEFAVLVEGVHHDDDAMSVARRLLAGVQRPASVEGRVLVPTASIGVVVAEDGDNYSSLLRAADIAMFRAKDNGRSRLELFRPEMQEVAHELLRMRTEIHAAAANGEFVVMYQPIFTLDSQTMIGAEALVRWAHPTRGQFPPEQFIAIAEETGAILELGELVLRDAARVAATVLVDDQFVTVNVSPVQLAEPSFLTLVTDALSSTGLAARRLVFEVTESAFKDDLEASRALSRLRMIGCRLAIDDFGTGSSALSRLDGDKVDMLKLHRDFVRRLADGGDVTLVRSLLRLCDDMGLDAIAEGVETPRERDVLRSLNCRFGQGYLFCRPVPAHELATYAGELSSADLSERVGR